MHCRLFGNPPGDTRVQWTKSLAIGVPNYPKQLVTQGVQWTKSLAESAFLSETYWAKGAGDEVPCRGAGCPRFTFLLPPKAAREKRPEELQIT